MQGQIVEDEESSLAMVKKVEGMEQARKFISLNEAKQSKVRNFDPEID